MSQDDTVKLWNTTTWHLQANYTRHIANTFDCAYLNKKDNRIDLYASGSDDKSKLLQGYE